MSHSPEDQKKPDGAVDEPHRCEQCDSVVGAEDARCLMCGAALGNVSTPHDDVAGDMVPGSTVDADGAEQSHPERTSEPEEDTDSPRIPALSEVFESTIRERQAPLTLWMAAGVTIFVIFVGTLILQNPAAASLAIFPTETPIPPTVTLTPTWTPLPSETSPPTDQPTITPTAPPTDTPLPLRSHTVASGETLFGISLRYGVSMESIAATSGLSADVALQVSQQLLIPWPTATPPLVPVEVDIGGETIIADPTNCKVYEIKGGDTFFGIAARERVDLRALTAANRLTEQSVLQPGDTVCIPTIIRGGVLPPTPGPSPTPEPTKPPPGPSLLHPVQQAEVTIDDEPLFLQWVAVQDLAEDQWYMVEMTDLSAVESHPIRGFTRQTSFQVPGTWRPTVPEAHLIRWRVTMVKVSGERQDGSFIYTFAGGSSDDAFFTWIGAIPTPTPLPTATESPPDAN